MSPRLRHRGTGGSGAPRASLVLAFGSAIALMSAASPAGAALNLRLETVADGLDQPVYLAAPPGDPRTFVVEQVGRIRVIQNGRLLPAPFLDIRSRVRSGGERGLLSVAFHPQYARNGFFYVDYTDLKGDTRVERYHVSRDRNRADAASAHLLLHIDQPYPNHNGGLVLFGPDGMLYIGMGDGGSGGDPHGNGQNPAALLGKLLRIDVDHGEPYTVPRDNPFVHRAGFRPEIYALGLRNPWRFCFDPPSGQLIIADVGQDLWEEIDAVPVKDGGWNFGWNLYEGRHAFHAGTPSTPTLTAPVYEFGHDRGCSIIGGFVYRGRRIPELAGLYLYSDYCDSRIRAVRIENGQATDAGTWNLHARGAVSSFGLDDAGEIYLTTLDGRVSRIGRAP
jgi:glucose/arabinose dehydrogenase